MSVKKVIKVRVVYDLSILGATKAGTAVFASNICDSIRIEASRHKVITFRNPFNTFNKGTFSRKISSLARQLTSELIYFCGKNDDYFFFPSAEVPLSILYSKKRFGITIHDLESWHRPEITTSWARVKLKLLNKTASRATDIFTVSEYVSTDIADSLNIDSNKITVIPNGLSNDFICPNHQPSTVGDFIATLPANYILNVGSIEPRKNIPFLIDTFELLAAKLENTSCGDIALLLTGGEGWKNSDIIDKINRSVYKDRIRLLGRVDSALLPTLYARAIATVLPAFGEGFCIPVIESLSQGTPVIVQNNTALSQFINYGAVIMDEYDHGLWVDALLDIVDCNKRLDPVHVASVKSTFAWKHSAALLLTRINQSG